MRPLSPIVPAAGNDEVVYAKDQPEYEALPCLRMEDGTILTRWSLNEEEKLKGSGAGIHLSLGVNLQPAVTAIADDD